MNVNKANAFIYHKSCAHCTNLLFVFEHCSWQCTCVNGGIFSFRLEICNVSFDVIRNMFRARAYVRRESHFTRGASVRGLDRGEGAVGSTARLRKCHLLRKIHRCACKDQIVKVDLWCAVRKLFPKRSRREFLVNITEGCSAFIQPSTREQRQKRRWDKYWRKLYKV